VSSKPGSLLFPITRPPSDALGQSTFLPQEILKLVCYTTEATQVLGIKGLHNAEAIRWRHAFRQHSIDLDGNNSRRTGISRLVHGLHDLSPQVMRRLIVM
jgi:hypothetical protein